MLFAVQALASSPVAYFAIRALQLVLLPLLIPAVITGSSNIRGSDNRARDLAFYTAGTIFGGVVGRLVAVGSVVLDHWQLGSLAITAMLLFSAALLRRPPILSDELPVTGTLAGVIATTGKRNCRIRESHDLRRCHGDRVAGTGNRWLRSCVNR